VGVEGPASTMPDHIILPRCKICTSFVDPEAVFPPVTSILRPTIVAACCPHALNLLFLGALCMNIFFFTKFKSWVQIFFREDKF
jgi:hypothetical protein